MLDRVDELVIKPVEGSGGYGIVFGPDASEKELAAITKKVRADPRGWIAQPVVQLSTVPTQIGDTLAPRHVDLRPFAVNDGQKVWVLPGGLTRVALGEGELIVNSSRGGGSKDTWVIAGPGTPSSPPVQEIAMRGPLGSAPQSSGPAIDSLSTQQEQQQQSSDQEAAPC